MRLMRGGLVLEDGTTLEADTIIWATGFRTGIERNEFTRDGKPCPPPAETLRWLGKQKNVKPCPNCHEMIQKNGGCDHMTCRPPGGCGHEFWFTCGCDYKKPHTCQAKAGQRY